MTSKQEWKEFAGRLIQLAYEIFGEAKIDITEKLFGEPKTLALALLSRTVGNFKGVVALTNEGLVVEARTLTRSCYENLFCIGALIERGDEFVKAMRDDQLRSFRSQGAFLLEDFNNTIIGGNEFVDLLRKRLKDMKTRSPKAKRLTPKETVENSVLRQAYLVYSQLSGDAAHPSVVALRRHLVRFEEDGEQVMGLDINPLENGSELSDTLNLACNAMIGACVGVNQILGGLRLSDEIAKIFVEYHERAGTQSLACGQSSTS